jgi:serine/threonine-protein kinase
VTVCRGCGESLTADDRFCPRCGVAAGAPPTPTGGGAYSPWNQVLEHLRSATSGEFHIVRELGRGGMAAVYLAQEIALNRLVAIKVMAPGVMMGEGMVDRFRQEAVTVANLSHPNIITIHTVRQLDDLHFFVMKYVDGRPLDIVLQTSGVLPIAVVRAILFQVGSGLAYAHRRGVIHRDVKPANILLDRDGNAIVTDFGIAKVAEVPGQTKTGTMVGTPAYMSPEKCVAEAVTWASDQYSLGIVAYELLTGAPPFSGSSYATMQGHLEKPPPPIAARRPDCPPELEAGVMRMLAKDAKDRFLTMAEALQALGARPLADDDPLRGELAALIGPPTGAVEGARVPRSPVPPSRATTPTPRAAMVALSSSHEPIEPGDRFTLDLAVSDAGGQPIRSRPAAWSSSDPAIVTVDRAGQVHAHAAGMASITAKVDEAVDSVTVHVRPPSVASVEVTAPRELAPGDRATASAAVFDRTRRRVTDRAVQWSSSDDSVASVDDGGTISAHHPGQVMLTALCEGQSAAVGLRVVPVAASASPAPAAPSPAPAPLPAAAARRRTWLVAPALLLAALGAFLLFRRPAAPTSPAPTSATRDTPAAPVAPTAGAPAAPSGAGTRSDTSAPRAALARTRLIARPATATLTVNDSVQLHASLVDTAGAAVDGPAPHWSSSDRAVALVDAAGRVTAIAPGSATISATALGRRATVAITVRAPRPSSAPRAATIALSLPRPLTEGDTTTLRAVVRDSAGRRLDDPALVWSSADPDVAGVDGTTGLVRAIREGHTTISATADGRTQRVPVVVTARAPATKPAPPPSQPQPAASTAAAGEVAVRNAAGACLNALRSADAARMQQLYQPATEADRRTLDKLLTLMRRREWAFTTTTAEPSVSPSVAGDAASGSFQAHLTWKNSFGQKREETVTFRVEARRGGDGSWSAAGCRAEGTPSL